MIDFGSPASPTPEQANQAFNSMVNLTNEIDSRMLNATILASGDVAASQRLFVTNFGKKTNHELALNGNTKDENLSSMPFSKQLELLTSSQKNINSAHICGGKVVSIQGFMPQSFEQNNDTFKVLESLGFLYDAGFKVRNSLHARSRGRYLALPHHGIQPLCSAGEQLQLIRSYGLFI